MGTEKKSKNWFGWAKNIISAIAGAVISCAATIGIIGQSDADIAKQKIDGWLEKADVVYVQVETASNTITEIKKLIEEKKYLEALGKLDTIKGNATTTIATVNELREEIGEVAKAVSEQAKEKGEEIKETVKETKEEIKKANDELKEAPATEEQK